MHISSGKCQKHEKRGPPHPYQLRRGSDISQEAFFRTPPDPNRRGFKSLWLRWALLSLYVYTTLGVLREMKNSPPQRAIPVYSTKRANRTKTRSERAATKAVKRREPTFKPVGWQPVNLRLLS